VIPLLLTVAMCFGAAPSTGRATAAELGVDVSMGGMPHEADRTFMSSGELLERVLAPFPLPTQISFAHRKIRRPTCRAGMFNAYFPADAPQYGGAAGDVVIGRVSEALNGDEVTIAAATHELLHALEYEGDAWTDDTAAGSPRLVAAVIASLPALLIDPRTADVARIAIEEIAHDRIHVFTTMGALYLTGAAPDPIAAYFAPMFWYNPRGGQVR
jgi:hypothetical protein